MRILRWRLKLAEYDYDVVYKAGKTNVNADALLRNPINLQAADCMAVHTRSRFRLNPDNPKDTEEIRQLLEDSDSDEEENLYVSHPFNHCSQTNTLNEDNVCDTQLSNKDPHQEYTEAEVTRDPQSTRIEKSRTNNTERFNLYDDSTPTDNVRRVLLEQTAMPETRISALSPNPTLGKTENRIEKISMGMPRTIVTRSRTKKKIEADVPSENPIGTKTRCLPSDSMSKETDEDRSNTDFPLEVTAIPQPTGPQNNANKIVSFRDLYFLRKDNLLYFTDVAGNLGCRRC